MRLNWCRHHMRPKPMVDACALGIDINALITKQVGKSTLGRHFMSPCHNDRRDDIPKAVCDKCSLLTQQEMEEADREDNAWVEAHMARMRMLAPLMRSIRSDTDAAKRDTDGVASCPVCKFGELHWRCSHYNGHIHAKCTTNDCVSFMQ